MTLRERLAWRICKEHAINVKTKPSDIPGKVMFKCEFVPFWHGLIEIVGNCTVETLLDKVEADLHKAD